MYCSKCFGTDEPFFFVKKLDSLFIKQKVNKERVIILSFKCLLKKKLIKKELYI